MRFWKARQGQEIYVFADNQAAIYRLKTPSDKPGQHWQIRCMKASQEIKRRGGSISIHWAPGHSNIPGNERADELAKLAAKRTPGTSTTSLAMVGIKIKELASKEWWASLQRYSPKAIEKNPNTYSSRFQWKTGKRLAIPPGTKRELASAFYQLKLGHGYNRAYLHRIGKADSPLCTCGAKQTPEHLLISCQRYRKDRKLLCEELDTNHLNLPLLLHTTKGIKATLAFISRTRVATRKWHLGQADE